MSDFVHQMRMVKVHKNGALESLQDNIIEEQRIAFYLNGAKLLSVMSLPYAQDAHLVGFLMNEGVLNSVDDIISLEVAPDGLSVYMHAHIQEDKLANLHKEKTLTTGCCVGVSANFDGEITQKFITSSIRVSSSHIFTLLSAFEAPSELFRQTGCVHKAMLVCDEIFISEDVGRHNAIDKVIGQARLKAMNLSEAILLVSGRLSMEMVIKAAMSDIPIVISRSATTHLGIQSAQLLGITLVGFARGDTFNIYTHPARIIH
ncbi:formate dehydrogenase accessory sulfurtransferase FdhD [Helicobacter marmotae]|uniref:Sulfur carrier protein FdhD n=1 Tax=Helicobacter marmotae TaxID=152490 RepID=A0A3D8I5P7_9HELI|nr:formate dehydrogenase accessory sulfurtransferase FdhD [Helicobacter marmotae]RDU60473.1 formate dehydrogenase accessory sulfurtransferase FdhD [Helicobacter marmotae]